MPIQGDNEENNRLSKMRQQARRFRNGVLNTKGGLDAFGFSYESEEQLENLKARQARIGNSYDTRQSRKIREAVEDLEAQRLAAIDALDAAINNQISKLNEVDTTPDNARIQTPTFDERERGAGLTDTDIGKKITIPTFEERERAAGLGDTTSGRSFFQDDQAVAPDIDFGEDSFGTFPVTICIDGSPFIATIVGQIGGKIT
jgi:hypothetical protein